MEIQQPKETARSGAELVTPYSEHRPKGEQIEEMFDAIAPAYDFMNTAMSFGLHRLWRSRAIEAALAVCGQKPADILDVATGTGDVALHLHRLLPEATITGIDLSGGMLNVARNKAAQLPATEAAQLHFEMGDCLALDFADNSFDLITVAYGVRNFEHLSQGLEEMHRVLRPGGVLCIIELSVPANPVIRMGYNLYSRHLIPMVGKAVSGDSRAYSYLPESIAAAPQRNMMTALLKKAGFAGAAWRQLTLGTVCYYIAKK